MGSELWHSVVPIYCFMALNCLAVGAALVWAWRRGRFDGLDETMRQVFLEDDAPRKENADG
jgi:nitrogen fixation-related uncharacterized protein